MKTFNEVYKDHAEQPYKAERYMEDLLTKPIPKRNMERTMEGFLPGHIILLWRINFGSYLTTSPHHKYFYTTYGIDAQKELDWLIAEGYVQIDSAFESLRHLSSIKLKEFLKDKDVKGLSKMKREDLDKAVAANYSEEELGQRFDLRSYAILPKGTVILEAHPEIVDKHPQKKY